MSNCNKKISQYSFYTGSTPSDLIFPVVDTSAYINYNITYDELITDISSSFFSGGCIDLITVHNIDGCSPINILTDVYSESAITANTVDVEYGIVKQYIDFSGTSAPTNIAGRVYFDQEKNALTYNPCTPNSDISLNIGQEELIRVYNQSGQDIKNGQFCYIDGTAPNGMPSIQLADASSFNAAAFTSGVATHDINDNHAGFITSFGVVRDIVVTGTTEGSPIFLSDIEPGGHIYDINDLKITSRISSIGRVLTTGTTGSILVNNIQNEELQLPITNKQQNLFIGETMSNGVFEFSGLTITSPTTFDISAIKGWIVNNTNENILHPIIHYIEYSGETGITSPYLLTDFVTYLLITTGSTLTLTNHFPTAEERRDNIAIGGVFHPEGQMLLALPQPDYLTSPLSQLRDMFSPIRFINDGVIISASGSSLSINSSYGTIWGLGINWLMDQKSPNNVTVVAQTPTVFQYRTQTGGTFTDVYYIDPLNYDIAGMITPLTSGVTNQRIYYTPAAGFRIQYGQKVYPDLNDAVFGVLTESFVLYEPLDRNAILVGVLSVDSTCTDLSDASKAQFHFVSKFGELGGGGAGGLSTTTLQQAYDNSSSPEIITNSILDGVQFQSGTGSDTDNVIIIQNNAGTPTAWIMANGGAVFTTLGSTGNCVNELYVSDIYGCSPVTLHTGFNSPNSLMVNDTSFAFGYNAVATGNTSFVFGYNVRAEGDYSHAEGYDTKAYNNASHAEGKGTTASGRYSHAEGQNTTTSGDAAHAEGIDSVASGGWSHAEGNSTASGDYSHAEGRFTTASGYVSHAEGKYTTASGQSSHAEGTGTNSIGNSSTASGYYTTASGDYSHAEGRETTASGNSSHAEGSGTSASGYASHAEGNSTTASGYSSHAEGESTTASGNYSHASGYKTTASGTTANAEGYQTVAGGNYSHSEGQETKAYGIASHASGYHTTASGQYSHVEGSYTQASGYASHAEGADSVANGFISHAEGNSTASGDYSHAEGRGTTASSNYSHAEGGNTTASGDYSHAEGESTKASGIQSHTEGQYTVASGITSHSEGYQTVAGGNYSHSEGYNTKAYGMRSHAEGYNNIATGENSHVEGRDTKATGYCSRASGGYTIASNNYSTVSGYNSIASGYVSNAEGNSTTASGQYSHAEGTNTKASGYKSHAEGDSTTASGYSSHAEGDNTTASGNYSHASGYKTTASGTTANAEGYQTVAGGSYGSHAEGYDTKAYSNASHAEGRGSIAIGVNSHAEGQNSTSIGITSHSEGYGTIARGNNSHAEGYYNETIGENSATIGGQYNKANGTNSVVIGGSGMTGNYNNTVYVPYLNIASATTNNYENAVLVRKSDGTIITRDSDTLFTGNTLATCINDIYVHNLAGCSPINVLTDMIVNENITINKNATILGNVTVLGTATTLNTETLLVKDNIITLNSTFTAGTPTLNSGIEILRGDESAVQLLWNENTDIWEIGYSGNMSTVITNISGTTNYIPKFNSSSEVGNSIVYDDGTKVGIGTAVPNQQLEITKNFRLPQTTYNSGNSYGIIYKGTVPFIHDFNYGNNGSVTTDGGNVFIGTNVGNLTMGSTATHNYEGSYNVAIGSNTFESNTKGYANVAVGYKSLSANTTGNNNTASGYYALHKNTTGQYNTAFGSWALSENTTGSFNIALCNALSSNTTGIQNTALGVNSLYYNTTGSDNSGVGYNALVSNTIGIGNYASGRDSLYGNTVGSYNVASGVYTMYFNKSGSTNVAIGASAGRYIANGATGNAQSDYCTFLGASTKPLAINDINEIVIGYNAIGLGSNTAVLGNSLITTTRLQGNVGIGTNTPNTNLTVVGAADISGTTSGSTVFNIYGTSGELFSVTDTLSGDLLSVINMYGDPILTVDSNSNVTVDGILNLNSFVYTNLSASTVVAEFDKTYGSAAYFDYYIKNSTNNMRSGTIMSVWDGTNVEYTDTATNDLNGSTANVEFSMAIVGSNVQLSSIISGGTWTIKTGVRII